MREYHLNLQPLTISRDRHRDPSATLPPAEFKQLRAIGGSLQWLVAQLRVDLAFGTSSLMGEFSDPRVASLLRAPILVADAKAHPDFELVF